MMSGHDRRVVCVLHFLQNLLFEFWRIRLTTHNNPLNLPLLTLSDPQFLPYLMVLKLLSPRFGRLGFRHDRGG